MRRAIFLVLLIAALMGFDVYRARKRENRRPIYRPEAPVGEMVLGATVRAIWPEPGGRTLWLAASDGLRRFDPSTGRTTAHLRRGWEENQAPAFAFHAVPGGPVWIATVDGAARFEPRSETFSWQKGPEGRPLATVVEMEAEPEAGALWFVEWGKENPGVVRLDLASGASRRYTTADGLIVNSPTALERHPAGGILAGGWRGVTRYDRPSDRFEPFSSAREARGRAVRGMAMSPDGKVLWMLLEDGIVRADLATDASRTFLPPRDDGPIFHRLHPQLRSGILWIETRDTTLVRFDVATGRFSDIPDHLGVPGTVYPETEGHGVWIGLMGPPARFDLATGRGRRFFVRGSAAAIYREPGGPAWIGTFFGLRKLDLQPKG